MAKTPIFAVHVKNWSLSGAQRFLKVIHSVDIPEEAASFILTSLFTEENPAPEVRSISITITSHAYLQTMGAAAFQSRSDLDSAHRTIEISEVWLAQLSADRLAPELLGVLRHELVHCFQNAISAPGGLIEEIADWVRLRSGLAPPHWAPQCRERWDEGYETTAYFLSYLETKYGKGTVAAINNRACSVSYSASTWEEILGKDVETLWNEYCNSSSC